MKSDGDRPAHPQSSAARSGVRVTAVVVLPLLALGLLGLGLIHLLGIA